MSDKYGVIFTSEALYDIRKIYSYIALELQVPYTAVNQINRIRKQIRALRLTPERHGIVDWEPWQSLHVYELPVDNYSVYYTVDFDSMVVTVIRIVYGWQYL
jgi:plasmid stabilization system protein ParE